MAKVSGKSGIVRVGSAVNIGSATYLTGLVTVNTSAVHGLTDTTRIIIESVVGMTDLNDHFTVDSITDTDTFKVALTTAQTYTSGGTVQEIIEVTSWSLNEEQLVINTTDSDSGDWEEITPKGKGQFSGTMEGFLYSGTRKPTRGTELTAVLETNGTDDFTGNIVLTSDVTELTIPGEDAVKVTFNFIGTGALA